MRAGRVWEVPANVYRDGRLAFAVGEVLDYDVAVAEGLVTDPTEQPAEPPKGKRKGGARARRPSEDRARRLEDDRDAGQ